MLRPYVPRVDEWFERLFFEPEDLETRAVNYMTRRDLSQRLKISLPSVDRLLASGDLPHCKIRRSVRISETDLSEYLARHQASAGTLLSKDSILSKDPEQKIRREDGMKVN
jgi:excisionase family DNA binding protein